MAEATTRSELRNEVVYSARVRVEARPGGIKLIHLPIEPEPVPMGMHGPIAKHYKIPDGAYTPHAATLDYIIGATAGCLMGTLNRALQVRGITTDGDHLQAEAVGEVEVKDNVLVIRRIRMQVRLQAAESQRETAERTVEVYASHCPVYRSLHKAIDITTELDFRPIGAPDGIFTRE